MIEVEEIWEGSLSSHKRVTSSESDQPLGNGRSSLRSELVSITMLISYEVVMIKHLFDFSPLFPKMIQR